MLTLLLLMLVNALATRQAVETWLEGSIFEDWQAEFQSIRGSFWPDLLTCQYCLSHWVAFGFTLIGFGFTLSASHEWNLLFLLPAVWLATVALTQLLHKVLDVQKENKAQDTKDQNLS